MDGFVNILPPKTRLHLELDIYEIEELTRLVGKAPYTAVTRKLYKLLLGAAIHSGSTERKGE